MKVSQLALALELSDKIDRDRKLVRQQLIIITVLVKVPKSLICSLTFHFKITCNQVLTIIPLLLMLVRAFFSNKMAETLFTWAIPRGKSRICLKTSTLTKTTLKWIQSVQMVHACRVTTILQVLERSTLQRVRCSGSSGTDLGRNSRCSSSKSTIKTITSPSLAPFHARLTRTLKLRCTGTSR